MKVHFRLSTVVLAVILAVSAWGCAAAKKVLPLHDDLLVYPLPFDLTYLRTLEALETHPDWELEETDKEKGLIKVRNISFSRFTDADKRLATFVIKRVDRNETTVQLAPKSQRVIGGDELLKLVAAKVSQEL